MPPENTKLGRLADILEGRTVIQKDLNRLEEWANRNLMKCSEVLHLGRKNPLQQYHQVWQESNFDKKKAQN